MKREVIEINEDLCVGCGLCANACHQSAIQIIDGKAKLVDESHCDGLGRCLPNCPVDAIKLVEKEVPAFKNENKESKGGEHKVHSGCPGTMAQKFEKKDNLPVSQEITITSEVPSELTQWPVQISLVNPNADYFKGANLLIAADCTAFAYGNFHAEFIKDHVTIIGCPKLDDNNYYLDKLTEIMTVNDLNSVTVVRMEVPCCGGIVAASKQAMLNSGKIVNYKEVTISVDGKKR